MKAIGRKFVVKTMVCTAVGVMASAIIFSTERVNAAQQQVAGQWVDPANPSDQLITGPYRVDPNWPKPFAEIFPEEKGWTWGAVQGVFVQNPDRIFVVMRGLLPDVTNLKGTVVEVENEFGMPVRLQVPGRGMYVRNASVGPYASPGEASDSYKGVEAKTTAGNTSSRYGTARAI